jgi:hypothetical protein
LRWIKGDAPPLEDVLKTMRERVAKFNRSGLRISLGLRVRPTKSHRREDGDDHFIRKKTCRAWAGE